jgi:hypothetical protein
MAMSASSQSGLTREEGLALLVALAAHVALIGALTLSPPGKSIEAPPERMTVTFADQIADQSISPDPNAEAAPDVAPVLGEPAPPEPAPQVVQPQPQPQPKSAPPPPIPQARPQTLPKLVQKPAPQLRVAPAPPPKPVAKPAPPKPAAAAPVDARQRRRPDAPSGASRLGSDFLSGIPGATNPGAARTPPAATVGPEVAASLVSGIARQIKPHWTAPQGVDADKLVTVLAWSLNPDGSLAGKPTVMQQLGITDTNRAQAQRHAEQAIRAVQLAAPFNLPAPYYAKWNRVSSFRFDRKLSQ